MERVPFPSDVCQDVVHYSRTLATSCPALAPSQVVIEEPLAPAMHPADRVVLWGCAGVAVAAAVLVRLGVIPC